MPHDQNNEVLKEGDRVVIPCIVKKVYETQDGLYCNVELETEIPMPPYTNPTAITLNTKQVRK